MAISPDRLWRSAILGVTALLPRRQRIPARFRLLRDLQLRQAGRADVFLVRHPKTGGTWLRVLLTRLYAERYGLSSRRVVRTDELRRQHSALPRFLSSSGFLSWEKSFGERVAIDPELAGKKLLLLARHPGDIAVSWYLQFTRRTSAFKRELLLWEMSDPIDRDSISQWDFVAHPEIGLPAIIDYYNFWARNVERMPRVLVVRYEDLRAGTEAELSRIADFLGGGFTPAQLRDAVEFASFESLRAKEESRYFDNRSLTPRDHADPDSRKVRRGLVGGYRRDLSAEQVAKLDVLVETTLDGRYGYAGGEAPVRELRLGR